jgi:UDP-N-acetyl-2-amino-2-deoxyglucuronate dehydrogenase
MNFAIIGLGFIAEKHIRAIKHVGGKVTHICDIKKDKWGNHNIRNSMEFSYFEKLPVKFYVDWEDMMESLRFEEVDYVVILTPNYLHYPMIKKARQRGSKVICEKPLVTTMDELEMLAEDNDIYTTLQLRYAYSILKKKKDLYERNEIRMRINVHRGDWYYKSWKVDLDKSGGLLFNIGIHYFDLLVREFGKFHIGEVSSYDDKSMKGMIQNERAIVRWELSIDAPENNQVREIKFGEGQRIDLTGYIYGGSDVRVDFNNLHNKVYEDIMKGEGVRPKDIIETTQLVRDMTDIALEGVRRKGV